MKKLILLMMFIVLSISFVSAYQLTCYTNGQIMPSGRACTNSICQLCLGNDGWSTLPQNCQGQECVAYVPPSTGNTTNTTQTNTTVNTITTVPPGWNYTDVLRRLEALETEQQNQKNLITSLQNLITGLQNSINNILLLLEGGGNLVGCAYNNPACGAGLVCQSNQCVSVQPQLGCQYNNPACGSGLICVQNQCVSDDKVVFRTSVSNGRYQTTNGEIAVDLNGDGNLECFKYESFYSTYSSRFPVIIAKTMENKEVHKYNGGKIIVRDLQNNPIYAPGTCTIPLASYPQAGYETREVYQ